MVWMTVHRLIANGILYGTKVQGKTFCSKSTLIDYLASEDTFRNPTCEGCKELVRTFKRRKSDDTYNEQRRERRKREREKKGYRHWVTVASFAFVGQTDGNAG